MKDNIDIAQRRGSGCPIAKVGLNELTCCRYPGRLTVPMGLRLKIVENAYEPAFPNQQVSDV